MEKLQPSELSEFTTLIPRLLDYFKRHVSLFKAGGIAHYVDAWREITGDSEILQSVTGELIPFHDILQKGKFFFN